MNQEKAKGDTRTRNKTVSSVPEILLKKGTKNFTTKGEGGRNRKNLSKGIELIKF
jgi:hypothetical protein